MAHKRPLEPDGAGAAAAAKRLFAFAKPQQAISIDLLSDDDEGPPPAAAPPPAAPPRRPAPPEPAPPPTATAPAPPRGPLAALPARPPPVPAARARRGSGGAAAPRAAAKACPAAADGAAGPGLPLAGKVFCFTGELEAIPRSAAEDRVKAAGGKVAGTLTGNTTYLVVGTRLDDGRPVEQTGKYRRYLELLEKGGRCPEVLQEEDFFRVVPPDGGDAAAAAGAASAAPATTWASGAVAHGSASATAAPARGSSVLGEQTLRTFEQFRRVGHSTSWVDRHAPRSFGELVGNPGMVRKLAEWLRDWEDVVLRGNAKKLVFRGGGNAVENLNARAALVSGPPGVGKTTACRLAARLHGAYNVLEFNASDARGQKVIQELAASASDSTTLTSMGTASLQRACLIMDEVDGMGAGDRGGMAALIKMIKKTKNPIICICNDPHSQKVRSLASSCYELRFSRPSKNVVAQRCVEIARREGLEVELNALETLSEACGGDIRMVLNQLQALSGSPLHNSMGVRYTEMKQLARGVAKDEASMLTPFDACRRLLERPGGSIRDRLDLFFVDFSLMGLLMHENYLKSGDRRHPAVDAINRCAYAADLMTLGDVIDAHIRSDQEWGLLPDLGLASCVYPAHVTGGAAGMVTFPAWFGKNSTQTRTRRLAAELRAHLRLATTAPRAGLASSGYVELLYRRAVQPLHLGDADAVQRTAAVLDVYGLRREHLMEHLSELRQPLGLEDLLQHVDPKMKAALTREFNSGSHAYRVVLPSTGSTGKRRAAAADVDMGDREEEEDGVKATLEEGDADEDAQEAAVPEDSGGGLVKVRAKGRGKGKGKNKAGASSGGEPAARGKGKGGKGEASAGDGGGSQRAKAKAKPKAKAKEPSGAAPRTGGGGAKPRARR